MRRHAGLTTLSAALLTATATIGSDKPDQVQIDACIDHLRAQLDPENRGGQVLLSSYSEAGTLVVLRDGGGTV